MEAILIYNNKYGLLGVAADYHSAILFLVECKWLTENLEVWSEERRHWVSVIELLGEEWLTKTLTMTIDEFNEFYATLFTLEVEDIVSYPKM